MRADGVHRSNWFLAGLSYAIIGFALGFVFGTLRTLFLNYTPTAPRLFGVLLELPFMLGGTWLISAWLTRTMAIKKTFWARFLMGLTALIALLCAEVILGNILFDRTIAQHIALYEEASYAIGLVGQIAFATFPLVQSYLNRSST